MTAADLLARLHELGVVAEVDADSLRLRGRAGLPIDLIRDIKLHREAIFAAIQAGDPYRCPSCREMDYRLLGQEWRACLSCGRRWGPAGVPDPVEAKAERERRQAHEVYSHCGRLVSWWERPGEPEAICGDCHARPGGSLTIATIGKGELG